jgi:Uma2 family endonuclease
VISNTAGLPMSTVPVHRLTPQEYLAIERLAPTKSEFYRGEMFAMSGASEEHNLIAGNVFGSLWQQFRGRSCKVYSGDMRVKVDFSGLYTYPDVVAICGDSRFEDDTFDTLLNPLVIVEVLSPSTEDYDRGKKFELYRQLPSLREYLVIAQDRVFVEHYVREADDSWRLTDHNDKSHSLELSSISCRLLLADVYDKVEFTSPGDAPTGT